ncbi:MAG: phosphatase PAP2 family protein [Promethearchaeota archaeon]
MVFFDPAIIIFLQSILPYVCWEVLNLLGDPVIYVVLLGIAFWCVNKREGKIAIMLVMFSNFINIVLKYAFGMPRPSSSLRQGENATDQSYGFPSGATQTATTFWGWASLRLRRWWVAIVGTIFVIITALARMGLGMHFLGDVIGGIIVAAILLIWAYFLVPYFEPRWKRMPNFLQDWLLPLIGLVFFFVFFIAYAFGVPFFPTENIAISMGIVVGFSIGLVLEKHYVNFEINVKQSIKIIRAILGVIIAFLIYFILSIAFSFLPTLPLLEYSARFIRYLLVGLFGAFLVPLLFTRIEKWRGLS